MRKTKLILGALFMAVLTVSAIQDSSGKCTILDEDKDANGNCVLSKDSLGGLIYVCESSNGYIGPFRCDTNDPANDLPKSIAGI